MSHPTAQQVSPSRAGGAGPAGWLLPVGLVLPSVLTFVYFVGMASAPGGVQQAVFAVAKVAQFLLPIWWWQQRGRPAVGGRELTVARAGLGIGLGVAMAAFQVGAALIGEQMGLFESVQPAIHAKLAGVGVRTQLQYLLLALFYCVVHSGLEEYYFRWFLWGVCRERLPRGSAHGLAAIGFMAHHVIVLAWYFGGMHPLTWLGSLAVAVAGLAWSWVSEATGSLWPAWLAHILADAAIFGFGYHLLTFPIPTP